MAGPDPVSFEAVLAGVGNQRLQPAHEPVVRHDVPISLSPEAMRVKPMNSKAVSLTNVIDIIKTDGPNAGLQMDEVKQCIVEKRYGDLPKPLCPAGPVPHAFDMQLVILPGMILKHVYISGAEKKAKWTGVQVKKFVQGEAHVVDWGTESKYDGRKAFQRMLEMLGGTQFLWFTLAMADEKQLKSRETIEAGFAFIDANAPRSDAQNAILKWITVQLNDAESPIFGWREALVAKAVQNLKQEAILAKTRTYYPVTLDDLASWFVDILEDVLPGMLDKALIFLGEPGIGKTPVCYAISMALSRYHINADQVDVQPSFRVAPDLDFFRGERGSKYRPSNFDDGDINEQPIKKMKTFTSITEEEAMTRERWGATKFALGEPRLATDNKLDPNMEPDVHPGGEISVEQFLGMAGPAFPKGAVLPDIMAILKRATVIINTKNFVYVKIGGQARVSVHKNQGSYLKAEAKRHLENYYKQGIERDAKELEQAIQIEQDFLCELLDRTPAERLPPNRFMAPPGQRAPADSRWICATCGNDFTDTADADYPINCENCNVRSHKRRRVRSSVEEEFPGEGEEDFHNEHDEDVPTAVVVPAE